MSGFQWFHLAPSKPTVVSSRFDTTKCPVVSVVVSQVRPRRSPQLWGNRAVVSLMVSQVKLHGPPLVSLVSHPFRGETMKPRGET